MKLKLVLCAVLAFCGMTVQAVEYHVSVKGNDQSKGTAEAPFRTIGRAAEAAFPGDVITVHEGTYREWVNPPRGGESDARRIVYRAAAGEKVEIKGSERITGWQSVEGHKGVWKVVLPNTFFGDYNPYIDVIYGDWFDGYGRVHHTGEVFLNEKSLYEKEVLGKVYQPEAMQGIKDPEGSTYTWYCEHTASETVIWANFHKADPNKELVEISMRPTCFYPEKKGINYITLSGFHISQAATQWGAPTAEQIGMVATHWNKGWIIENNVISNSKCSGITLGKERNSGHNKWLGDTSIDGSLHYIEVVFNAIREGWNKEDIGHHIVRNNTIFACEQTGMCGSMGASWSLVENNHVYDIWTKRQFNGAEIGGIKFHAAIDAQVMHNRIHCAGRALWLDWMTQGTRVSSNVFYDNDLEDVFLEVNHGPFILDNNILASRINIKEQSQGGAYIHNLFFGKIFNFVEHSRYTPYFLPHSVEVAGLSIIPGGDDRFYNNLFAAVDFENCDKVYGHFGLKGYEKTVYPMAVDGNVYYERAIPYVKEENRLVDTTFVSGATLIDEGDKVKLVMSNLNLGQLNTPLIHTGMLGKAKLPKQRFENPDGSEIRFDKDYFGNSRGEHPVSGPIEALKEGKVEIVVWSDRR